MTTAVTKATPIAKPKASIVTVTPKDAERWLSANTRNRALRQRLVEAYARDMSAAAWQLTGEAIKFTVNGDLLDGQHRLHAVVMAGVPVDMLVVRGIATDAQEVMDSGAKRQASDALALRGHKNTALLASTARMGLAVAVGGYEEIASKQQSFTTTEISEFVDEHPEIEDYLQFAMTTARQMDCAPTVVAYAMWRLYRIDPDQAQEFFDKAGTKVGIDKDSPILSMLRRFAEARRNREHLGHAASLSIIFRAWNAVRDGKPLYRIPITSRDGLVAVPEPK